MIVPPRERAPWLPLIASHRDFCETIIQNVTVRQSFTRTPEPVGSFGSSRDGTSSLTSTLTGLTLVTRVTWFCSRAPDDGAFQRSRFLCFS
jgi:hypothetical protein